MHMKKLALFLSFALVFTLILSACAPDNTNNVNGDPGVIGTDALPDTGATEDPLATEDLDITPEVTDDLMETPMDTEEPMETETPLVTEEPLETQTTTPGTGGVGRGAEVIPVTGSASLNLLSTWMGFDVVDQDGEVIGTASDYILNMCEAHVLYIVVDADTNLGTEAGQQVLIPYELVTLNNGVINGEEQTIQVNVMASDLQGVPTVTIADLDLENAAWESEVIAFWSDYTSLSLTTECEVSAFESQTTPQVTETAEVTGTAVVTGTATIPEVTPTASIDTDNTTDDSVDVTKIMLASQLIGAELESGNGTMMGTVTDAIVTPRTGLIRYVAVEMEDGNLVLVPTRAVNIQHEGDQIMVRIILLVEEDVLRNAPTINSLDEVDQDGFNADAFDYWSQYVPLTEEDSQSSSDDSMGGEDSDNGSDEDDDDVDYGGGG